MTAVAGLPRTHEPAAQRRAAGRVVRKELPRRAHAEWAPAAGRDPVAVLEAQAATRLPELVPLRHGRMLASPFAFFRGGAAIMAADLASLPHTRLETQLCGDAHLSNFGFYHAPDRRLVFSVNDFDESLPGPFEWDLKRLVASFAIAGRDRGFGARRRRSIVRAVSESYRTGMREFAALGTLDMWYSRIEADMLTANVRAPGSGTARTLERAVEKAYTKHNRRALDRLCDSSSGTPRIRSDPPTIVPVDELVPEERHQEIDDWAAGVLAEYADSLPDDRRHLFRRFGYAHAARKVVGVGSVGTRCWILLLLGRDDDDPLFLQFKEAQPSVLEPHLGAGAYESNGRRIVEGQRLLQAASDILLGWIRTEGLDGAERDFYVRQLWDGKGSAEVERMDATTMTRYGRLCALTLARAHARAGDAAAIGAYVGSGDALDRALVTFAEAYADQNERDFAAVEDAVRSGRLQAQAGV